MDGLSEIRLKNNYQETMYKDGVIFFNKLIPQDNIRLIKSEVEKIRDITWRKIKTMERPLKTYADIAERHLGRFDYRCGFTAKIFAETAEPIIKIIQRLSPTIDFRFYWGAIPSLGGSGPTDMHRDIYPILNTTQGYNLGNFDLALPPYYFTVLIPLVEITSQNGPTQFIKGSHRIPVVDDSKADIYAPLSSPGDIIIFDGRTLHKGSANHTTSERVIAYITFVANWYHDQTFMLDDYLFPELR